MNILVTGATGFLGGVVCRQLLERGHDLTLLGRDFSRMSARDLSTTKQIQADLRDSERIHAACQGIEAVCHAGALSSPWGRARDFEAVNLGGTRAVLEGCLKWGVRRLVQVSSPSVVFDGFNQHDLTEDAPYPRRQTSHYSHSKQRAEELILGARALLEVAVLRPKALYGPSDTSLLPRVLESARRGRLVQIGNGLNRVDLTYVDDAARALVLALEHPGSWPARPLWFVTGGEHVLLWEVIGRVLAHVGPSSRLRRVSLEAALAVASALEAVAHFTGKEPTLTRYTALILACTQTYNLSRIEQDLGYVPRFSLEEGLNRTLEHPPFRAPTSTRLSR